jgi:protease I
MKRALIITYGGFQDQEVIYPYYRLLEAGFEVVIAAESVGPFFGITGTKMIADLSIIDLGISYKVADFDFLCLPGGVKAIEKLRQQSSAIDFISEFDGSGKIIASICHGAQLLISAGVCKNRKILGYFSIKDDIINAGGVYPDSAVAVDKNIISSPHYAYMGEWMKASLKRYKKWKKDEI